MKSLKNQVRVAAKAFALLLLLTFAGCEEFLNDNPKAIFLSHYVNYAWGYQNSGYIIDTEGNLREFSLPDTWNYHDSDGYISETAMQENLDQLDETSCIVAKYDMAYFAGRLEKAMKGKITAPEHRMCDAGGTTTAGYIYEPGTNRYKYVFIRQTGDWYSENTSREAADIYEWLQHPCDGNMGIKIK